MLRRIFRPQMDEVTGLWRRLYNELNDLYSLLVILRAIKSKGIRWRGHVARVGDTRGAYRVLVGRPEGKRSLGRSGINGRVILKRILKTWDAEPWTGLIWLRTGTGGGLL